MKSDQKKSLSQAKCHIPREHVPRITFVSAVTANMASDKLKSFIFESILLLNNFLWLTKYQLELVYIQPKMDQNKQKQTEKIIIDE